MGQVVTLANPTSPSAMMESRPLFHLSITEFYAPVRTCQNVVESVRQMNPGSSWRSDRGWAGMGTQGRNMWGFQVVIRRVRGPGYRNRSSK